MKQNSIVTFRHSWGDFQSKSLEIWHIWPFVYVPRCEWALMRWTPWNFLGEVVVMSPHDGCTHPQWRVEGRGMRTLSQIIWDDSLSYSLKTHFYWGALTSHFMEEHSSPTSIFPVFMMTSSNGNMFRVTGFCAGNSPVTAGKSPVTGEFQSHRPVTRSFDVFFDLRLKNDWVNKQDACDLRDHRSHYDVTAMWCWIVIQWSGQPWDISAFNASLLSNSELVKRVKLGVSVHYGRNGLKFGTLLYPDNHSLKVTIFCTQRQFKFVVSDHPQISFELGRK